ncbi:ribosomal biogenesis GTPase [Spiroplasma syrphidicola EA-1]|uniref:Ribosome biogenesis GTPase A n=1 Tax=Spiroplasma syrphidicola EA-1 TaxID=1276229 RepID=R4U5J0_9MOLU|nr:ribosome biogenesis GTPase YlqF [Spiroplasma syrphidicola]AGM25858.1 ribosomal biogenesis GTPase [Spiroplasma syrphidicola EA-1]
MRANIHWFPGHMAKTIRQLDEQNKLIDLVIEIVDSRIPNSSRNPLVDKIFANKPKLMILNKKDLADPKITAKWINYYQQHGQMAITLNSKDLQIKKEIIAKIYEVLAPKINKALTRGIKNPKLKVLIIGIPNVGKSTFINALIKRQSAKVGNKPGVTKGQQWLKLNEQIDLVDTPGILWPKFDDPQVALNLAFTRSIKEDILPKEEVAFGALKFFYQHYFAPLKEIYQLTYNPDVNLDDEVTVFNLMLEMQTNKFKVKSEDNIDRIVNDFLNHLWNNQLGLVSFESPLKENNE